MRELIIDTISYPIKGKFTISRGSKTHVEAVLVYITQHDKTIRAECVPYARYGETVSKVIFQMEEMRSDIENCQFTRDDLCKKMLPGAARNALDCALFALEAQQKNIPVWQLAGLQKPLHKVKTAYTISLDTPDIMAQKAKEAATKYALLKIKLGAEEDEERMIKIRQNVLENTQLIADANEGWQCDDLERYLHCAEKNNFSMIEQPIAADEDDFLIDIKKSCSLNVLLCADESFHSYEDLDKIAAKYDMINIKLDKTGGLTEALKIQKKAQNLNLHIMIGCMLGSSLAMAPAFIIAQNAMIVDLDGPLLLSEDQEPALSFEGSYIYPPDKLLWG